jgi:hypothetical protein
MSLPHQNLMNPTYHQLLRSSIHFHHQLISHVSSGDHLDRQFALINFFVIAYLNNRSPNHLRPIGNFLFVESFVCLFDKAPLTRKFGNTKLVFCDIFFYSFMNCLRCLQKYQKGQSHAFPLHFVHLA